MAADEPRHAYFFDQLPKSLITAPADGATLSADEAVEIEGLAWAGENPVESVELSTDGGGTWVDADLGEQALGRYAWRRFRAEWNPEAGKHRLLARATDTTGRIQPTRVAEPDPEQTEIEDDSYPWNTQGYGNNAHRPLGVSIHVGLDDA
ncbi:Ig-like domain-containing protein [Halalkalicoccus subterraneus]|uniref:Ig-like domain-containing protein n=1 Tax=Halalkalicoccus subterraneus TaxID=2675002 RepID=UPI001FE8E034|nr:Ig-like domain-containing protein [Halalkalicoccus subterraneus]